jgi:uncharacterized protein
MDRLDRIVEHIAHWLPAQGPLSVFIHHNTLHAFEELPFERAVVEAGRTLDRSSFLSEERYRQELGRGRITPADVATVLDQELGPRGRELVAGLETRFELRRRLAVHGIPEAHGVPLLWLIQETEALSCFRDDLPTDVRETMRSAAFEGGSVLDEAARVRALWSASLAAVARSNHEPEAPAAGGAAWRDRSVDEWIDPVLIRFVAAFLDQGLAHWPLPERDLGLYRCFLETYAGGLARLCGPWAGELPALIAAERAAAGDGRSSVHRSLVALGVPESEWAAFLGAEALALRGWAGMVRQIEERPDRVPTFAVPARLVDYLAVRLLLVRAASASTSRVRTADRERVAPSAATQAKAAERAWPIFHVAQLCGLDARAGARRVRRARATEGAPSRVRAPPAPPLLRRAGAERAGSTRGQARVPGDLLSR